MAMTEQEWLECNDPQAMLDFLRGKVSDRKLRLFAVRCCGRISNLLDNRAQTALAIADQFADDLANEEQLRHAEQLANDAFNEFYSVQEYAAEAVVAACDLDDLEESAHHAAWLTVQLVDVEVAREQCRWMRDMHNPFRPVTLNPAWRTSNVTALAQAIYDDRASDRLPILADALKDAGCDNADILNHCRQPGVHVRGCWVLDLILGKE
jgi:hypothetical protein